MKRFIIVMILSVCFSPIYSQTMSDYFRKQGVETTARLAHPTNTYKSGKYSVSSEKVWMKIYYRSYTTELNLTRDGDFFTKITVLNDDDFVTPFSAIELLKDLVLDLVYDNSGEKNKSKFEELVHTSFSNMTGKQLACLAVSLDWLDYKSSNSSSGSSSGSSTIYYKVSAKSGLYLRNCAGLDCSKIVLMPYGSSVKFIERTDVTLTYEGISGYWFKVSYNGKVGYAFNGFLN